MIYFNGRIVSGDEAHVPLTDAGLLYGFGFFETFRTSGGRPHHWTFNRSRLMEACERAQIGLPAEFLARDENRLNETVRALLNKSQQADAVFRCGSKR
jgi:4-amino-4-deoxychorismate lyase